MNYLRKVVAEIIDCIFSWMFKDRIARYIVEYIELLPLETQEQVFKDSSAELKKRLARLKRKAL